MSAKVKHSGALFLTSPQSDHSFCGVSMTDVFREYYLDELDIMSWHMD